MWNNTHINYIICMIVTQFSRGKYFVYIDILVKLHKAYDDMIVSLHLDYKASSVKRFCLLRFWTSTP